MFRNIGYSCFTQILPLLAAVLAIPPLIVALGDDRFGLLTLAWVFLGYFSLFDLGLGRATTKFVAEYRATNRLDEIPSLVWTSWSLLLVLGMCGGLCLLALVPWLFPQSWLLNGAPSTEIRNVTWWIALSIPFVILTSGVRAVLEAHGRFRLIAAIGVPGGIMNYLLPFTMLSFTHRLDAIVLGLLVNRTVVLAGYVAACVHVLPGLGRRGHGIRLDRMRVLLGYGGYITLSNVIGPLMTYLDRFMVAAMESLSAVAYYATPTEIIGRLRVFPASVMPVLFPAFTGMGIADPQGAARLFHRAVRYIWIVSIPLLVGIAAAAPQILRLWISEEFAARSAPVLAIMATGSLANYGAQVAYNWIQASGRARVTALFHVIELPIFFAAALLLVAHFGVLGMAWAWFIRIVLDAVLLFRYALRLLPAGERQFGYAPRFAALALGYGLALWIGMQGLPGNWWWIGWSGAVLATYPLVVYAGFLTGDERNAARTLIMRGYARRRGQ